MRPLSLLAILALSAPAARADDLDKLQGKWKVTSGKAGTDVATPQQLKEMSFDFNGRKLAFAGGARGARENLTIVLHGRKDPKQIDFLKGPRGDKVHWHGIYEFEDQGRTLRICFAPAEAERPNGFSPKKGQQVYKLEKM